MLPSVTGPVAVIMAKYDVFTVEVVIGKVVLVLPCETVALAGTDAAAGELLVKLKVVPPAGAGALNVIVAVELPVKAAPPITCCGLIAREFTARG